MIDKRYFKECKKVVSIGSALVDILVRQDEQFLTQMNAAKGGMLLVEYEFIQTALNKVNGKYQVVPGGSACNTAIGIGNLGGMAGFVGKYGKDDFGSIFEKSLTKNNVAPCLFNSDLPTGRVFTVITPDAQRTMFTYLGAAAQMQPEDIDDNMFSDTAVVHIEGYLVFNRQLIEKAFEAARKSGARISLDLASFNVVEECLDFLKPMVSTYVDILIANEDEARAFTGLTDEMQSLQKLSEFADIAVLKVGKRGSYISHNSRIVKIEATGNKDAVDTTGAGDLWASGFLYGLVNGFSLEKCGQLGSHCGYEVCQVVGASIPDEGWQRIKQILHG